jgi:hypothetical protein
VEKRTGRTTMRPISIVPTVNGSGSQTVSTSAPMVGNDIDFAGNNTTITGILLVHNQINMTGGKTINGYIVAADGLLPFAGDPHPAGSSSTINPALTYNKFLGSSQINYINYGTANPMGPPILRAWNDGQW